MSAAVVLMIITSIGVYGYLTNSYQETAKVIYKTQNEITLLDQKKKLFEEQKIQLDKSVEDKNNRLKSLDQIRVSQQNAYTQQLTQKRGTGGLSKNIASVDKSSENLNNDISTLTQKSFALSDSIASIEQLKLTLNNETFSSELGPLLYLSRITGIPMDVVVNWFIIILVIVFDPLAVSLVIAANHLSSKEKQKETLDELSKIGQEIQNVNEELVESFPKPVNNQITDSVTQAIEEPIVEPDVIKILAKKVIDDVNLGEPKKKKRKENQKV
jgi:flagellar biosynthesis chaperone FliJ